MKRLPLLLIGVWMMLHAAAQSQPFTISNGYFEVSGDEGVITSLRLDASGGRAFRENTIAQGGCLGFSAGENADEAIATKDSVVNVKSSTWLEITHPGGYVETVRLLASSMTHSLTFTGSARPIRHIWDLVYLDQGYFNRGTGENYFPQVSDVKIPFESFYSLDAGSYRPIELFKQSTVYPRDGEGNLGWLSVRCRGRGATQESGQTPIASDVILTCTEADQSKSPLIITTSSDKFSLQHPFTGASGMKATFQLKPKSYRDIVVSSVPLPEFYVSPEPEVRPFLLSDNVSYRFNELLTEFFQHSTFWWGPGGYSGGIWSDWAMMSGCFMNNAFTEGCRANLTGWVIGDDGYGRDGYAYTWGKDRGWPFPDGKDTRHFNTNAIYLTALWRYLVWTGDMTILEKGSGDRRLVIHYGTANEEIITNHTTPAQLAPGSTLGQTFTATKPFTGVSSLNPTWETTNSGFKLTLYTHPQRQVVASVEIKNAKDNATNRLSFSEQPAGEYYLEMSDAVGTVGWWSNTENLYSGGTAYVDGVAQRTVLDTARLLMKYQQEILLGAKENMLILGENIGSKDHLGRTGDVGSTYYDILPFGYKDNMTNIHYYLSVRGMADIEALLGDEEASNDWTEHANKTRELFNQTFWRTGLDDGDISRYIGCVNVNGEDKDFGYTFLNTMAMEAGLASPQQVAAIYHWLENGRSDHGLYKLDPGIRIQYADGREVMPADTTANRSKTALQLTANKPYTHSFFVAAPFTSVAIHTPTWNTTNSAVTIRLYTYPLQKLVTEKRFTNVSDNGFCVLNFETQPEGYYLIEMSEPSGTIGCWATQWVYDIYQRWVFSARSSTVANTSWWPSFVSGADRPDYGWRWDIQLQNGGSDLYEAGFDVISRARHLDPNKAWDRLNMILRRYVDPDRMSQRNVGFYGEGIQGGPAGSVGWMFSEFPETSILGASFFLGFFDPKPSAQGLMLTPRIPSERGITTLGARNIWYQGGMFDFEATGDGMTITLLRNGSKTFFVYGAQGEQQLTALTPCQVTLLDGSAFLTTQQKSMNEVVRWANAYE